MRNAGYKVVLTGEGSDEILAGYPHFRRDMLLYNSQGQRRGCGRPAPGAAAGEQPGLARPAAARWRGDRRSRASAAHWVSCPRGWRHPPRPRPGSRALFAPDFAAEFAGRDPYRVFLNGLDVAGQLAGREPVNQSLYLWSKVVLPNYVLTVLGDRMEMAHSVEGRVPFLDHHVVELARDLPLDAEDPGDDGEVRAA